MRNRNSRDYNPSRNSEYSTHHRHGRENYAREAERSRRIEKRDRFDRDFNLRADKFSVYDENRDIDRPVIRVRSSRSPRRTEIRGRFDRDDRMQTVRLSAYDAAGNDKDNDKDRDGRSRRFYDEDPHHVYSVSPNFHRDFHLDESRKSNGKDYSYRSFHGAGDTDITRGSGERDYSQSRYSDSYTFDNGRIGGVVQSSYTFDNGRIGGVVQSNLERDEFGSRISETGLMNSDTEKRGYFHMQNQLLLEKRNRAFCDGEKRYSEKEEFDFHYQDGRDNDELGIERPVERESSKYMEENLFSSRESNFFSSLAQSENYVSSSSGILREKLPGSSSARQRGSVLASESIYFNEYTEKQQYVSPKIHGDQRTDTRSWSRSYLGPPEEKHGDHFYAEFGKSEIERDVEDYKDQRISRMSLLDPIVESSHGKCISDDRLWDPYSSLHGLATPEKFSPHGSLHARKRDVDMNGGPVSRDERSDVLRSREYELSIGRLYDSPRKRLALWNPSLSEPSERRPGDEHFRDEVFDHHVRITKPNDAPNGYRKNYSHVSGVDKMDLVSLPKKHKSSKYNYEKEERVLRHRDPHKSDSGNKKRRLGPVPRKHNLSQRVVKKYKPYMKKRVRPAPLKI